MKKFGSFLRNNAHLIGFFVLAWAVPVGHMHASTQTKAAHERWGDSIAGEVVGFSGPVAGEAGRAYRPTRVQFVGRDGQKQTVTRLLHWETDKGDRSRVWQASDGAVFVRGDMEPAPHFPDDAPATNPWPSTLGTYLWRLVWFGLAGWALYGLCRTVGYRLQYKQRLTPAAY